MKNSQRLLWLSLVALPAALLVAGSQTHRPNPGDRINRGRYLVNFGGCADCHTPRKMTPHGPVLDPSRHLAGHRRDTQLVPAPGSFRSSGSSGSAGLTAWSGPWGVSYAANLTPDPHTGLGIWTEEMFVQAMRTGKHFGVSRDILPPMPWERLSQLADEDLRAIYAYLRSIPAVNNRVPDPVPAGGKLGFE